MAEVAVEAEISDLSAEKTVRACVCVSKQRVPPNQRVICSLPNYVLQ